MIHLELKEKLKFLLEQEVITQEEYDLLFSKLDGDEEVEAEKEEVKPEEVETNEEATPEAEEDIELETEAEEVDEEVDEEVEQEVEEEIEPEEVPEEVDETAQKLETLSAQYGEIEEIKKTNEALAGRVQVLEELVHNLSVKEDVEDEFGATGTGKTTNGGEPMVDSARGLWSALGGQRK